MAEETIGIKIKTTVEGVPIERITKSIKKFADHTEEITRKKAFFKETGKWRTTSKEVKNIAMHSKVINKAFKGFNIFRVMLPLVFGFQRIGQAMKSAVDPALQMVGATDLYQELLAVKYLPTALEQLDNLVKVGDEWLNQSEAQRKAAGDMALWTANLSEAIEFTAQMVLTGGALGSMFGPLGEKIGNVAGGAFGLSASFTILDDDTGRVMTTFGGLQQAVGIGATDALVKFGEKLGIIKDEGLPTIINDVDTAGTVIKQLGESTGSGWAIALSEAIVKHKGDVQKALDEVAELFKPGGRKAASNDVQAAIEAAGFLADLYIKEHPPTVAPRTLPPFVRKRALGGIVTRPELSLIGESGPEAIIPLNRAGAVFGDTIVNVVIAGGINSSIDADSFAREISFRVREDLRGTIGAM